MCYPGDTIANHDASTAANGNGSIDQHSDSRAHGYPQGNGHNDANTGAYAYTCPISAPLCSSSRCRDRGGSGGGTLAE